MKALLSALLTLALLALPAQPTTIIRGPVSSAVVTPVFSDDIAYANNTAATNAGWTTSGTSATFAAGGVTVTGTGGAVSPVYTYTGNESWHYFVCEQTANASDQTILNLRDSSGNAANVTVVVLTTGFMRVISTTSTNSSTAVWSINTEYEVLVRYVPGTSGDAIIQVWLSTDGTWNLGSPVVNKTNGGATVKAQSDRFAGAASSTAVVRNLRVFTAFPGNNVQ